MNIYRYKFSEDVMKQILNFSKIHQHDTRDDYKEAWSNWIIINDDMIAMETRRLEELGYVGDVEDKMYKAGRYYFRSKNPNKTKPCNRREYISMSPQMIQAMDSHIADTASNNNFTPANGYNWFCEANEELLLREITILKQLGKLDADDLISKIKKTYKNRYHIYRTML